MHIYTANRMAIETAYACLGAAEEMLGIVDVNLDEIDINYLHSAQFDVENAEDAMRVVIEGGSYFADDKYLVAKFDCGDVSKYVYQFLRERIADIRGYEAALMDAPEAQLIPRGRYSEHHREKQIFGLMRVVITALDIADALCGNSIGYEKMLLEDAKDRLHGALDVVNALDYTLTNRRLRHSDTKRETA